MLFIKLLLWYCWIDSAFFPSPFNFKLFFFLFSTYFSLISFPPFTVQSLLSLLIPQPHILKAYTLLTELVDAFSSVVLCLPSLRPQQLHCCCLFYVSLRSRVRFALISSSVFRLRLNIIFENIFVAVLRDRKRSSKFFYLLHVLCGSFSFFNVQDFSSFVLKYVFFSPLNSQFSFLKVLNEKIYI